tara:strand:- start:702 stop:1532 length:831 start_codon:yes stop_codon:yes gene_type:complete
MWARLRLSAAHQQFRAVSGSLHERFGHTLVWRIGRPALRVARVGSAAVSPNSNRKKNLCAIGVWVSAPCCKQPDVVSSIQCIISVQFINRSAEPRASQHACWALLCQPAKCGVVLVALKAGVYLMGYSAGVRRCLEDPDAVTESMLKQVLSGANVARSDDRASLLTARIGHELLQAAQAHLNQIVATSSEEHAETPRNKLQALLRHKWRFVVIESEQVNAFVADLLPGFVFVNRGLVSAHVLLFACCCPMDCCFRVVCVSPDPCVFSFPARHVQRR